MLASYYSIQQYEVGHTTISGQRVTKRELKGKEECYKRYINSFHDIVVKPHDIQAVPVVLKDISLKTELRFKVIAV